MSSSKFLSFSCCLYSLLASLMFFFSPSITIIATGSSSNVSDHEALLHFKSKITLDLLGVITSWNHTTHFCQWHGVTCSKRHHQRVIGLDLNTVKLSGSISPFIGNLSFLRELQLQNNSFINEIPPQMGRLRRLQILSLSNNSLSGNIPVNLSSCSNLVFLQLGRNQLVGEVHPEFGSLMKLKYFSVRHNQLTGSIPSSLGNLSSLQSLFLGINNLYGGISHTLGQLKKLTTFSLRENNLSGVIPPSVFNTSALTGFDVGVNKIHGTLPMNLGTTLPNIQFFCVTQNKFTGLFPSSLSNITSLAQLHLTDNYFWGKVPSLEKLHRLYRLSLGENNFGSRSEEENDLSLICTLTNASALQRLLLGDNNFEGVLPECLGNLSTKLNWLTLQNNFITGRIPDGIGRLTSLMMLTIFNNRLSGTIPASIGRLQNLESLDLSTNQLSGHIPSSIGNLTQLINLFLYENNLIGSIPQSLGNCNYLLLLSLYDNSLSGPIPPEIFKLSSLSVGLYLFENNLTGPLPMEVQYLKNVNELDVSENMLSGEIPSSLGSCTSLEVLSLQGNHFRGIIPSSLSSLRGLQRLNLSRNNLSGKLPEFLADLNVLISLNLSYNNFEGVLPARGVFTNTTATSIVGNSKLCGGIPEFLLPKCSLKRPKRRKTLVISVIFGLFGVILLVALVLALSWFKEKRKEAARRTGIEEVSMLRVSYNDLLKATDGFSSTNLIGEGSFGSVYKGVLDQHKTLVAVKVFNLSHKGAHKSFIAECEALRNIRHRNLVKVLTACSSADNHGNDFKALVYEFMVNGSLEDWLHSDPVENGKSSRNLNFVQRLDIAIHVACALEYLHQHCETPIIHCDLKPSNVLLDNDMVGHVGDFGLAKFLAEGVPNQSSSVGVRGTIGYAPAEYGLGSEVSVEGDIYSFGILLMEMFTGKRPTDSGLSENGLSLRDHVMSALPNKIAEIIDPILLVQGNMNIHQNQRRLFSGTEQVLDHIILILKIGISCSVEIPKERIPISELVAQLCAIRNKFLGS